jgi:hypothetical protein
VSRPDPSGADQIDAEHQATDLAVGGSNRSRTDFNLHRVGQQLQLRAGQRPLGHPSGGKLTKGRWATEQQGDRWRSRIATSASSGGLPQNRRRDYCGRCQAVQEDTSLWSAGSAAKTAARAGPRPTPNRVLGVSRSLPASLGRLAAIWRRG